MRQVRFRYFFRASNFCATISLGPRYLRFAHFRPERELWVAPPFCSLHSSEIFQQEWVPCIIHTRVRLKTCARNMARLQNYLSCLSQRPCPNSCYRRYWPGSSRRFPPCSDARHRYPLGLTSFSHNHFRAPVANDWQANTSGLPRSSRPTSPICPA
jgi:hypothetical protein